MAGNREKLLAEHFLHFSFHALIMKRTRYNMLIIELYFVTFGQTQANFFPLFPVSALTSANWLLAPATYLRYKYESGIDFLSSSCQESE